MTDTLIDDTTQGRVVAAYLKNHPHFLSDYPELAAQLTMPREQGAVASLAMYQLQGLRDKNAELERRLAELIAIAADTTSFGVSEDTEFRALAASYGIKIAADISWTSPASSLTSQALKLGQSGAKAVFIGSASGPDVTLLAKTMVQNAVKLPLFGPGGVNAPGVPAAAGSAYTTLPGVYDITSYDSQVTAAQRFMSLISKQTGITQGGENPTQLYDAFMIAAAGLAKSNGQGGQPLVTALQSLGQFPTMSGGPGTYVDYTATQHSGLFGPHLYTIYKWDPGSSAFAVDSALSATADKASG